MPFRWATLNKLNLAQPVLFAGSPIIHIDDWREGDKIIKQLLADPARIQALHEAALRWWQEVMAEPAVARHPAPLPE